MAPRYLSTFSHKRGRPRNISPPCINAPFQQPTEYIDQLHQRGDIAEEHHLAAIYYRVLHYQVYAPLGLPILKCKSIISLSRRFKPYRSFFTPEEQEDWYIEKTKTWKELRRCLVKDSFISLEFIDDLLIYRSMDCNYYKNELTSQQLTMLERALTQMAQFFGLINKN